MTIVHTSYRPKRARKRKHPVAIPMRIVTARKPGPAAPAIDEAVTKRKKPAQTATITSRIITAPRKRTTRFGPVQDLTEEVQDLTEEEYQRRGDAAEALFKDDRTPGEGRCRHVSRLSGTGVQMVTSRYRRPGSPGRTVRRVSELVFARHLRPVQQGAGPERGSHTAAGHAAPRDHLAHAA